MTLDWKMLLIKKTEPVERSGAVCAHSVMAVVKIPLGNLASYDEAYRPCGVSQL